MSALVSTTVALTATLLVTAGPSGSPVALDSAHAAAPRPRAEHAGQQGGTYLVVLRSRPLATYTGGLPGFPRTAPRHGERFDADRPAVRTYESRLLAQQDQLLTSLGSPPVLYRYTTVLDGFAATLTSDQVASLRAHSDVLAIERSRVEQVAGAGGTALAAAVGRPGPRGDRAVWKAVGGPARAGRGIVIGVVDTGLWPDNPSFAAVPLDRRTRDRTYPGFTGHCEHGERWPASTCNAKVLAARSFVAGFGTTHLAAVEYSSPRDGSGHGSHVAAIAAGNAGVDVSVGHQDFGRVSGVAPAAGLAVYKACWSAPDPTDDGCATPDTAKAVDQAVRDGVDVLAYSGANHDRSRADVLGLAFLNAASAGVFVAAAAGNDGPAPGTVSHASPWVTTVAASEADNFQGAVVLGDGTRITGAMVSNRSVGQTRLVYARDVPAATAGPRRAAHCFPGSLDASKVEDAVVVCDRGLSSRVTKSQTVKQAGGAAMVLVNNGPGSTDADLHAVPTVHLTRSDGARVKAYLQRAAHPTARLDATAGASSAPAVASWSSRGPASVVDGDVLKPDLTAPGDSVLAAVAPPSNFGHLWDLSSGTSMAAPDVAGLAAVVAAAHPDWSASMTKSALMTTARPIGAVPQPLSQGAGEVDPRTVLDPGLVYAAGLSDWLAYLRSGGMDVSGLAPDSGGGAVRDVPAIDLNAPSISVGSLVGEETVTRTVTNVGGSVETYHAHVTGLRGIAISVSRPSITLRPGQSARFAVTFSARRSARYGSFAHGSLAWTGSAGHVVRSPIVVRPELVDAPAELTAVDRTSTVGLTARAGVTGTIRVRSTALVGSSPHGFVLSTGPFDPSAPDTGRSTHAVDVRVPARSSLARFEVRTASPGDDLDLYVYRDGRLVGAGDSEDGDEVVTLTDPAPGLYTTYVHAASATGDVTLGSLTSWVLRGRSHQAVGSEETAPLSVRPSPVRVTGGRPFGLTVSWRRLDLSKRWLGVISYGAGAQQTFVVVN